MKFVVPIAIVIVLTCCQKQTHESRSPSDAETTGPKCYEYISNGDTILLNLSIDKSVTGTLVYNLFQKDKNTGTIQGDMNGPLLIADYSFFAEGVNSVRQVVFKKVENTFVEGSGDVVEQYGKTAFKNIDSLKYDGPVVLTETACEK